MSICFFIKMELLTYILTLMHNVPIFVPTYLRCRINIGSTKFTRGNVSLDENNLNELGYPCFFAANVAGTKYF